MGFEGLGLGLAGGGGNSSDRERRIGLKRVLCGSSRDFERLGLKGLARTRSTKV